MNWNRIVSVVVFLAVLNGSTGQTPVQVADMVCITDVNTGIMTATMVIYKKTSKASRVFFTDANFNEFTGAECIWNGDGTDADPFKVSIEIDTNTHNPPTGQANCGHKLINATDFIYKWIAYNQLEQEKATGEDVVVTYQCSAKNLPTEVSLTYEKDIENEIPIPSQIGTPTMYFTSTSALTPESVVTSPQELGTPLYLRLRFQPSGATNPSSIDPNLSTWGVYCRNLYASPSSADNFQFRRVDLLDANGCPRNDLEFLRPANGFRGTRPTPGDLYYSTTGVMEAANFDLSAAYPTGKSKTVYVVCEAELCWRPEDQMCIDRCAALTGTGRRRRSSQPYIVVANFTVVGNDAEDGTFEDSEMKMEDTGTRILLPVLVSVGALMLVTFVTVAICVFCRRSNTRKYKNHQDTPSVASDKSSQPPYYFKEDYYEKDRMSRMHPAFMSAKY